MQNQCLIAPLTSSQKMRPAADVHGQKVTVAADNNSGHLPRKTLATAFGL